MESRVEKKVVGGAGFGDGYGVLILPKETEHPLLRIRPQLPDLRHALKDFVMSREAGEFLNGALAGAMTKPGLAPPEDIRTRMVVGVGSNHNAGSYLEVIEHQGWQGLWAGNAVNMVRIIPTQSIELGIFECVKRALTSMQEKWNEDGGPKVQIGRVTLNLLFPGSRLLPSLVQLLWWLVHSFAILLKF